MGSLYFKSGGVKYILSVIYVFIKLLRLNHIKIDKKAKTVLNGFIGIVKVSKCKPNKL